MDYVKCIKREYSLTDIKIWHKGESDNLKKLIGFGFNNHLFVSRNGIVTLYYEKNEGDEFDNILDEKLTEEFFDEICNKFFELIEKSEFFGSDEEIIDLLEECWPIFTIFDEVSKYPEYGTPEMLERLFRIRRRTESFSYNLLKKIKNKENIKDYIFFKGKLIFQNFEDF